MYKELIKNLAFSYNFLARGKGKLDTIDLKAIQAASDTFVRKAPEVLRDQDEETTRTDETDLKEAQLINGHIEEMVVFQLSLEIC